MGNEALCSFYGLGYLRNSYRLQSFCFDYTVSEICEDWSPIVKATEPVFQDGDLYLFISLMAERTWERKKTFSEVVFKNFAVVGDTVAEWDIAASPYRTCRVGAVKVTNCSIQSVLQTLYASPDSAFAMVMQSRLHESTWISELLTDWNGKFLDSTFFSTCIDAICAHNATFLHLLKGCDGFSINCISLNSGVLQAEQ